MEEIKVKAKKIRIKAAAVYELGPTHVTQLDGVSVSLTSEDVKGRKEANKFGPGGDVISRAATQPQLRKLYDQGNPLLEEIEE